MDAKREKSRSPADDIVRPLLTPSLVKREMLKMGTNKTVIEDIEFKYVCTRARKAFKLDKEVEPIHLNDIFKYELDVRKSNPGIPWHPRYRSRGEVMDHQTSRNIIKWFWYQVKYGDKVNPPDCRALYRAHLNNNGNIPKVRVVYGFPTAITLMEACFALPLIDEYRKGNHPMGYGFDSSSDRLRDRLASQRHFCRLHFDWFNETVSSQLIDVAFLILMDNIDFRKYCDSGVPDLQRLVRAWNMLVEYFKRAPLMLHNGRRWMKMAGIPDGSYFTQLIGSIVSWIVVNYAYLKCYRKMPVDVIAFGGDSLIVSNEPIDEFWIAEAIEEIGMEMQPRKCVMTSNVDEVDFLRFNIEAGFPVKRFDRWTLKPSRTKQKKTSASPENPGDKKTSEKKKQSEISG